RSRRPGHEPAAGFAVAEDPHRKASGLQEAGKNPVRKCPFPAPPFVIPPDGRTTGSRPSGLPHGIPQRPDIRTGNNPPEPQLPEMTTQPYLFFDGRCDEALQY